jgi:predicted transcriptional regulator
MKYRSRTDIISQILETANGGDVTKAKIMYKHFLAIPQLKEYLTILTESHLLRYDQETHAYKVDKKFLLLRIMFFACHLRLISGRNLSD